MLLNLITLLWCCYKLNIYFSGGRVGVMVHQQNETREQYQVLLKASLDSLFLVNLSQDMSQTGPLAEMNSGGKRSIGRTFIDFYRLWRGCQQEILPDSWIVSVWKWQWEQQLYNSGIPHSAIQCWVSCPNVKSQLWAGFMHIHRDETSCTTKATYKPSVSEPTWLL